jgi:hypothetical protein
MPSIHSHSARNFLERNGVYTTRRRLGRPRLDTTNNGGLLINSMPLEDDQLNPALLLDAAGSPPPDRGKLDPWPPPQEVSDGTEQ